MQGNTLSRKSFWKVKKKKGELFVEILTQLSPAGANSSNHRYPAGMTTEVRKFNPSGGEKIIPSHTQLRNLNRKELLPTQVSKSRCSISLICSY
jgi:hypothetical protein